MKRIIYILTGIVLLSLSSCSDFLEPKSQSEYVPKDAKAFARNVNLVLLIPNRIKAISYYPFLAS